MEADLRAQKRQKVVARQHGGTHDDPILLSDDGSEGFEGFGDIEMGEESLSGDEEDDLESVGPPK